MMKFSEYNNNDDNNNAECKAADHNSPNTASEDY